MSVRPSNKGQLPEKGSVPTLISMGFRDLLGFELVEWRKDWAVVELELNETHHNRNRFVHGGVVMSLLDTACGFSGVYCDVPGNLRRCITISMNTSFMKPVSEGVLRAEARVVSSGRKIFFVDARVFHQDTLVATASGTFRYVAGGEDEQGVPAE
ncbi:PaaI family thioesterase [Marinobacter sediminicola]|uniref:PaaI family thioesterase n=1 Tax=Marinobacter sediminicola TaxID=3072994 RepID=UPI0028110800|nr:PaaI family thioesterase [Marinobacter sp. F26243]